MRQPQRRDRLRFLTVDTQLWDDDVLWELPVKERKQVSSAMVWGRPLPPRLARVAVQHAPALQAQAWYGWMLIALGLLFGLFAALTTGSGGWLIQVAAVLVAVAGLGWLLIGAIWLRAVTRARRAARTGRWPETRGA